MYNLGLPLNQFPCSWLIRVTEAFLPCKFAEKSKKMKRKTARGEFLFFFPPKWLQLQKKTKGRILNLLTSMITYCAKKYKKSMPGKKNYKGNNFGAVIRLQRKDYHYCPEVLNSGDLRKKVEANSKMPSADIANLCNY